MRNFTPLALRNFTALALRRTTPLALAVVTVAALPAAASAARGFSLGVAAGDVTSSSAILWAHSDRSGRAVLEVSRDSRFRRGVARTGVVASRANDNTVQARVRRLRPGTRYFYRFRLGRGVSDVGRFVTAPAASSTRPIEFAFSGDADAQRARGQRRPFYNNFEVYRQMAREGNHFNVNLGDTIYSDTEVGGRLEGGVFVPPTVARTVAQKWAKYRQNLALSNLQLARRSAAFFSHWDDHEFINDFSIAENGGRLYRDGVKAFRDYAPVTYTSRDGLYRSFRYGRNLEVFYLDERSFRDAKASHRGTCDNPETGDPDLAPTAPQDKRNLFSILIPSLRQPVSQACLDRIRDPRRTMLGSRQFARFTNAVARSRATFKVVMSEVPIQQFYALPYDRWEGYEGERQRLLNSLRDRVRNVVFLTTDAHANYFNEVRLQTLEPGGPVDSGFMEMVTGPVATKTQEKEINEVAGRDDAADLIVGVFYKPQPPDGVGMDCASLDVYSYTQVRVTSTALTITPKDNRGNIVREKGSGGMPGPPCGPYTIRKR